MWLSNLTNKGFNTQTRELHIQIKDYLICIVIVFSTIAIQAKASPESTPTQAMTQNKSILWLSDHSDPKLDPIVTGFKYEIEKNQSVSVDLEFDRLNKNSEFKNFNINSLTTFLESFDYVIAVGDKHWNKIKDLQVNVKKMGLMLSGPSFEDAMLAKIDNTFAISKDQSIERIFLTLSTINPRYSKTSAFFSVDEKNLRLKFETVANQYEVPFKAITLSKSANTYESINSASDCCKTIFLRDANFNGSLVKKKSLLINAYKRKIITLTDNKEMLKHGAMLALYSQPHEIGRQAARLLAARTMEQKFDMFQMPQQFMVEYNHSMRQALGHQDMSTGDLIRIIKQKELQATHGHSNNVNSSTSVHKTNNKGGKS